MGTHTRVDKILAYYHGQMASSFRRYLVCFYCNRKSAIRYDGLLKQWECGNCEATNYLDENGEITDPPVATYNAAPADRSYAIPRPEPPYSSQKFDGAAFCSTCIKNQHLYYTSLQQYEVADYVPNNRELNKENEIALKKFKMGLEKRYPQVCVDCQPKVLDKMKQATRVGYSDIVRRKNAATRAMQNATPWTLGRYIESVGKSLWYLGLFGQLLWHIIYLAATVQHLYPSLWGRNLPGFIATLLSSLSTPTSSILMKQLAWCSLVCSCLASWWNPKFNEVNRGFMKHLTGFRDWYSYQGLIITIRFLFHYMMGVDILAAHFTPPTITANVFVFGFITYLAIASLCTLKVDMTRLWAIRESFRVVGPSTSPKPISSTSSMSMSDLARSIGKSTAREDTSSTLPSKSLSEPNSYQRHSYHPVNYRQDTSQQEETPEGSYQEGINQQGTYQRGSYQQRSYQQDSYLREEEDIFPTPKPQIHLQPRKRPPPTLFTESATVQTEEPMDWTPSYSQHRAFAPNQKPRNGQLFGQAPVDTNTSPFWYKVPPAPITPAHRLRNPPNQPNLRVASKEVKENFFNNVTRKSSFDYSDRNTSVAGRDEPNYDSHFAEQKFFPPTPPSEADDFLAERLTSFSLSSAGEELPAQAQHPYKRGHVYQFVALLLGLIFWNQVLVETSEIKAYVNLVLLVGCFCVGIRKLYRKIQGH